MTSRLPRRAIARAAMSIALVTGLAGCASQGVDAVSPSRATPVVEGSWDGWWTTISTNGGSACRQVTIPADVLFAPNSDAPGPRVTSAVRSALEAASAVPGPVVVLGYTDDRGPENIALSRRRAQNVAEALVAGGLSRSRLQVRGRGESSPVASNSTESGRARNRRVEIRVGACSSTAMAR